ncbi:MAG: UDP-glucose 4-epimerase GalE, partial [Nitrospira sp.]|nr:UDP-glucose 4-epimerase GalE [Nitrospira sp.]
GAGYIGSHMTRMLSTQGHTPIVLDTLEHGHPEAIKNASELVTGDCGDQGILDKLFEHYKFDACIHFAGYLQVGESVENPAKYFNNNITQPSKLLQQLVSHKVPHVIFSSSAAVYGIPQTNPIPEDHPKAPINPYGLSKYAFEQLLGYYDRMFDLHSISLRYFNASGASLDGNHGESHSPESHLIPKIISAAMGGKVTIFGNDYATPDGTCVRDYIHIEDLCQAHLLALEALRSGHPTDAFNVGTGTGLSNIKIADTVKSVSGKEFEVKFGDRRAGDPPQLIADSSKLQKELGWQPKYSDIETIIKSAWTWHSTHPTGYNRP